MKRIMLFQLATLLTVFSIANSANAQAYCALRDPVRQIGELYSGYSYTSNVGIVTTDSRKEVGNRLPFNLHFNELGAHTLYTVTKAGEKVGYVHVRPEITRWGLMEITWSLDPYLRLKDFTFQRCRNRRRANLEAEDFKKQLRGKSFDELLELISLDGKVLSDGGVNVDSLDDEFAAAVIRCALKTIAVTSIVWEAEVKTVATFPADSELEPVEEVYTADVKEALQSMSIADNKDIDRANVKVYCMHNDLKNRFLVETRWFGAKPEPLVKWYVSAGTITRIGSENGWPSKEVGDAFRILEGKNLAGLIDCKTAVELSALEVLLICRELGQSK